MNGIIGKKIGMSHFFMNDGKFVPVSLIEVQPSTVLAVRTTENDGYSAVQVGSGSKKKTSKNKLKNYVIKEIRSNGKSVDLKIGDNIAVDIFHEGDYVDVTGTSKGKGFQGGMKRWGWRGGEKSHGSMFHRRIGSVGASSYPSRIHKGKTMPGHMGNQRRTMQNLEVANVDKENNLLILKGSVPGSNNSYVLIRTAKKKQPKKNAA